MRLERFQLVDRVDRLDLTGKTIACRCEVPLVSEIFEGHFPGHPLLPGTLMIEMIAQAAGLIVLAMHDFRRMPVLISVDRARVRAMVKPGTLLAAQSRVVQEGAAYVAAAGHLMNEDRTVAEAEIRLGTLPFPTEALRAEARRFAEKVALV